MSPVSCQLQAVIRPRPHLQDAPEEQRSLISLAADVASLCHTAADIMEVLSDSVSCLSSAGSTWWSTRSKTFPPLCLQGSPSGPCSSTWVAALWHFERPASSPKKAEFKHLECLDLEFFLLSTWYYVQNVFLCFSSWNKCATGILNRSPDMLQCCCSVCKHRIFRWNCFTMKWGAGSISFKLLFTIPRISAQKGFFQPR